jgi:hypothetical protein
LDDMKTIPVTPGTKYPEVVGIAVSLFRSHRKVMEAALYPATATGIVITSQHCVDLGIPLPTKGKKTDARIAEQTRIVSDELDQQTGLVWDAVKQQAEKWGVTIPEAVPA